LAGDADSDRHRSFQNTETNSGSESAAPGYRPCFSGLLQAAYWNRLLNKLKIKYMKRIFHFFWNKTIQGKNFTNTKIYDQKNNYSLKIFIVIIPLFTS
jgi:hypothetical protein